MYEILLFIKEPQKKRGAYEKKSKGQQHGNMEKKLALPLYGQGHVVAMEFFYFVGFIYQFKKDGNICDGHYSGQPNRNSKCIKRQKDDIETTSR